MTKSQLETSISGDVPMIFPLKSLFLKDFSAKLDPYVWWIWGSDLPTGPAPANSAPDASDSSLDHQCRLEVRSGPADV